MKSLTKVFFCSFGLFIVLACEPEGLPETQEQVDILNNIDEFAETGDQKQEVDDDKEAE